MKIKNKIFFVIFSLLIIVNVYYYGVPLLKDANESLQNKKAELSIHSNDLISAFKNNEEASNEIYSGKIIEVSGTVKEITFLNKRTTIILNNIDDSSFGVICDLNPLEINKIKQISNNQKIKVKGICKGYLKDVILLNCSIEILPNE